MSKQAGSFHAGEKQSRLDGLNKMIAMSLVPPFFVAIAALNVSPTTELKTPADGMMRGYNNSFQQYQYDTAGWASLQTISIFCPVAILRLSGLNGLLCIIISLLRIVSLSSISTQCLHCSVAEYFRLQ